MILQGAHDLSRREAETISETLIRKAKHHEAAARYRTAHRTQLRINEWQRRLDYGLFSDFCMLSSREIYNRQRLKRKKELEEDEAEFQALMAAQDSDDK